AALTESVEIIDLEDTARRSSNWGVHLDPFGLGLPARAGSQPHDGYVAPDHEPRQPMRGRIRRQERFHTLALAEDSDPVSRAQHLLEVVRDENDRGPFRRHQAELRQQL